MLSIRIKSGHFKFNKKFGNIDIDEFMSNVHNDFQSEVSYFHFDLSDIEWISNQNLLVLTSLWSHFIENEIEFKVVLFQDYNAINIRQASIILQLWDVWKVYQILPSNKEIQKYFNIPGNNFLKNLRANQGIGKNKSKIFDRYGITPFLRLPRIDNFKDINVLNNQVLPIYSLNSAINELIKKHQCEHPFVSETISAIITKELYENYLDHNLNKSSFNKTSNDFAYMCLSLKAELNKPNQSILKKNFQEEELSELEGYYKSNGSFLNRSQIELSFLDFGPGIPQTLRDFNEEYLDELLFVDDNELIKRAFEPHISRHPIINRYGNIEKLIPRGLFDIFSIVKRYHGVLIVRSNLGKVLFDFSHDVDNIINFSEVADCFFPGTLLTIYIPQINNTKKIDLSAFQISYDTNKIINRKDVYINFFKIIDKLSIMHLPKSKLYIATIDYLKKEIKKNSNSLIFFDFKGWEIDRRIAKVLMYYMATSYDISLNRQIVVLNPPEKKFITEVNLNLAMLLERTKTFQTFPIPFARFSKDDDDLTIDWIGIFNAEDEHLLNQLLTEYITLPVTDFQEPENIHGNVLKVDKYGNLSSENLDSKRIIKFYKSAGQKLEQQIVDYIFSSADFNSGNEKQIFICSGNYYTKKYISIDKLLLNDLRNSNLTRLLFNKIEENVKEIDEYIFIGVIAMSHRIIKSLLSQKLIKEENSILIDNYHQDLKSYKNQNRFRVNCKYALIGDVLATGYLTLNIAKELEKNYSSKLKVVGVFINSFKDGWKNFIEDDFEPKIFSLHNVPNEKYDILDIPHKEFDKDLIRVNPFTNQPVYLKTKTTVFENSILLEPTEFLNFVEDEDLKIRYLDYNNALHPYFFDMEQVLRKRGSELMGKLFSLIQGDLKYNIDLIFFPKNSGIRHLDFAFLKDNILKNQHIQEFEIERYETEDGFKFPHLSSYYEQIIDNKKVLLLDDASCSGDSIMQLIDEISFFDVKEIIVLIILGRVSDQRREFFSRLDSFKGKNGKSFKITIIFGCHWHIPTYSLKNNPIQSEINWLDSVISLPNTPITLRNIVKKIRKEILPIPHFKYQQDYKYLPKKNNIVEKKDIALARNAIGKITGFRFYQDGFNFFNDLTRTKEDFTNPKLNKPLEILCATLVYEPFLYENFKNLLPDIAGKLERFVTEIILDEEFNLKNLYYDWDNKDIVYLFFIIYQKNDLIFKLKISNLLRLFYFCGQTGNGVIATNYILYKLLNYHALKPNEIVIKNLGTDVRTTLDKLLQIEDMDNHWFKEIRRFRKFLSTLPHDGKFQDLLSIVVENYRKLSDDVEHSDAIISVHSKLLVTLQILSTDWQPGLKLRTKSLWDEVSMFISNILELSITYPNFFLVSHQALEGNNPRSLRVIEGIISDEIKNLNQSSDFELLINLLTNFNDNFLEVGTRSGLQIEDFRIQGNFYSLFTKITTDDPVELVMENVKKYSRKDVQVQNKIEGSLALNVPYVYFEHIILKEIFGNFRHAGDEPINIELSSSQDYFIMQILNVYRKESLTGGGGNGMLILKKLNHYPDNIFSYEVHKNVEPNQEYRQTLKIKSI